MASLRKAQLIKWHTYLGLFTFFYIIAFGFSSLVLNHGIEFERGNLVGEWDALVSVDTSEKSNRVFAEQLRDQLDIMGWPLNWRAKRDGQQFSVPITNPGKEYELSYDYQSSLVHVKEFRKSFWSVLNTMHFFGGKIPNASPFIKSFRVYQYLGMIFLLASMILGIWLWFKFSMRSWELYLFGGIAVLSVVIMYLI